jgi:F-type H+-transporting ATPase subunit a
MAFGRLKSLLAAAFTAYMLLFSNAISAQHEGDHGGHQPAAHGEAQAHGENKAFDANEVIFDHILDAHEYHFFDITQADGTKKPVGIPLPVILYEPGKGFSVFMSSKFHHGHTVHNGYRLLDRHFMAEHGLDTMKTAGGQPLYTAHKIYAVDEAGMPRTDVKIYDISLTRNVVQMILALVLLSWIMISVANRYKKGQGVKTAPKGMQNLIEPVITFVRDEVAKPNLGHKYERYMPLLLTIFFFILINNIFGLIPGSANVTGNIAFTLVLGVIAFFVILFSSNKHFWGHIFNPPGVPAGIKFILVPVEFLGVFIKPIALIIRLFANMIAGHIIIICLISLIFIFGSLNRGVGWGASPVAVGFTIFIYFIEVLVAFLQAYIFTMLTAVFTGMAFEGEHHAEEGAGHH